MADQRFFDGGKALFQQDVGRNFFAKANKGTDNIHAHGDGMRAVEDVCGLKRAMLREDPRERSAAPATRGGLWYRSLRCQSLGLLFAQLETEVFRKARLVALNRLIEAESLNSVNARQVRIQNDALTTHVVDDAIDGRHKFSGIFHRKQREGPKAAEAGR